MYGNKDFLCSKSCSSISSKTSSNGSSIAGVDVVFWIIFFAKFSFSISLRCPFPKVACFNKIDSLAVSSLTSNLKSLAPLKVL